MTRDTPDPNAALADSTPRSPAPAGVVDLSVLYSLLDRWADARDRGTPVGVDELADDPVLRVELGRRIALEERLAAQAEARSTLVEDRSVPAIPGYEIVGELGRGGMGVVYQARDLRLNRTVAIKMVLGGIVAGSNALSRFLAEAEALAALDHPNVVHVHGRGEYQGLPYFVMEFCPGGSLGAKVRERPLPAREAAGLIEQLARGVGAAHARNILHRDLKPDNVLFAADGTPKVTDFGLAKRFDESGEAGAGLTVTGAVMGTPSYMAPEQARGDSKRVGPAADVYALGAVLYRLLTGRPPFLGANLTDTVRQVVEDEPLAPTQLVPSLPRDLSTICLKCLHKDPTRRYTRATDLAEDVRRFLDGRPIQARPVGSVERATKWVRRNPVLTGSAIAVVLALTAGTAVSYWKYRDARHQEGIAIARVGERDAALEAAQDALGKRDDALNTADAKARDLKYQLGVSSMLLAGTAYENRDVALAAERLDEVPVEQRAFEWHYLKRQVRGGLFTLYGHTGWVSSVAYSRDGARVVTGSTDHTARVWDARTGALLVELRGHTQEITGVGFSPDGARVVTGSYDQTARIWDARSGALLGELRGHTDQLECVAFSPDGNRVVTGSHDKTARVWDAVTRITVVELKGHAKWVASVAFGPDGLRVVTGSQDGTARVWDARSGATLVEVKGTPVSGVAFSPDGSRVMTGFADKTARVWDARTGEALVDFRGHAGPVTAVAFSPDGSRVATGSYDRTVRVWNARTGVTLVELKGHTDRLTSVAFSPDGARVTTGSEDRTAQVWDASTGTALVDLLGHTDQVSGVAFSPDGTRVATGSWDNTARVWDARSGAALADLKGHRGRVNSVAFSPDRRQVLTASEDRTACLWDARTGAFLAEFKGHGDAVFSAAFSPDGAWVVTGSGDKTARIWDARTRETLFELRGHTDWVSSVAFSPDGARVVTGSGDKTARVWDAETHAVVADLQGHSDSVISVGFSPDGARVVTGSYDQTARVWDARTGAALVELKGHTEQVSSAAFSPDGTRVATGSWDNTARVWDARTGTSLVALIGHTYGSVAFSPDGTRLATGSWDRTARVWDTHVGAAPVELSGHTDQVADVAFSPDGARVATGGWDKTARVWNTRTGATLVELKGHTDWVTSVAFSPDGAWVATGCADGTGRVWDARTGETLVELKGRTDWVNGVAFSPDGARVVTWLRDDTARVWDARSGRELPDEVIAEDRPPGRVSPDGQLFALPRGKRVELVGRTWDAAEVEYRLIHTRPNVWRYLDGLDTATENADRFGARFYLDRLLSLPAERTVQQFRQRNKDQADACLTARAGFHHPELSTTPYDRGVVHALAVAGDRLARRLVAQERLREGKPKLAVPLLFECLLTRPVNGPPVEELLLARAYLDLDQPAEARRFYNAAVGWLDRPRDPMRAANVVTHAINPWNTLAEAVKPVDDPRHNPFDWESWHETDVFRADVGRRLRSGPP